MSNLDELDHILESHQKFSVVVQHYQLILIRDVIDEPLSQRNTLRGLIEISRYYEAAETKSRSRKEECLLFYRCKPEKFTR